jgi:hypothetical protein
LETYTNLMCENRETERSEGKTNVSHRRVPSIMLPAIIAVAVVLMITLALVVIPLYTVHRVYVTVGQDTIVDVSAQTTKIPFISKLFPSPSNPTGVYTIIVQVQGLQVPLNLSNVPIGTYTFDLQNVQTGVPLTITVSLIRNSATIDTFSIQVTF